MTPAPPWATVLVVVLMLAGLGAIGKALTGGSSSETTPPPITRTASDADFTHTSTCDYVLGDFTENTTTGFRLVAGADIRNVGGVGLTVEVTASWERLGTFPLTQKQTAQIPVGVDQSVQFTVSASRDTIDLVQSAQMDGTFCDVGVVVVGTF